MPSLYTKALPCLCDILVIFIMIFIMYIILINVHAIYINLDNGHWASLFNGEVSSVKYRNVAFETDESVLLMRMPSIVS